MSVDTMLDAILPAGGRLKGGFADEAGTHVKALISFDGRTILERTLAALRETGRVRRIVVVGPEEVAAHPAAGAADAVLPDTGSAPGNILQGVQWLGEMGDGPRAERALVLTTDLPFVTPEGICTLLDLAPPEAEIAIPAVRSDEFEARFGIQRRYARLRDGDYLLGCAAVIDPLALERNRVHITRAYAARKSVLALAYLLGPRFLLGCIFRRFTADDVASRCGEILGCTGRAVHHCAAELAFDIDRHGDYRQAVQHMSEGAIVTSASTGEER